MGVMTVYRGSSAFLVPYALKERRRTGMAIRYMVKAARRRKGLPMHMALPDEFLDAHRGAGRAVEMKVALHKMAEANKAYVHFRW